METFDSDFHDCVNCVFAPAGVVKAVNTNKSPFVPLLFFRIFQQKKTCKAKLFVEEPMAI